MSAAPSRPAKARPSDETQALVAVVVAVGLLVVANAFGWTVLRGASPAYRWCVAREGFTVAWPDPVAIACSGGEANGDVTDGRP